MAGSLEEKQMQAHLTGTQSLSERRGSVRVPLSTPYRWEFRLQNGFFDAVASDLGEGGMFVNTANPQAEGSDIDFEVQFAGMALIEGRGEVAWVRKRGSQPGHSPGMGIRFLDLDIDSHEVVRRAVAQRLQPMEASPA